MKLPDIFDEIKYYRVQQRYDQGQGKLTHLCSDPVSNELKLIALAISLGHVSESALKHGKETLREELTKLATLCVMWLESMSEKGG